MKDSLQQLLKGIGEGCMSSSAYDTAWIALLGEIEPSLSNLALGWLNTNQLPDGSWGAAEPFYYHDRIICTLAAMIALYRRGKRSADSRQIALGLRALETMTDGATKGLMADPSGATVGFEMIVPTLICEAEQLGIIKQQGDRILGRISHQRELKMAKLAGHKINRYVTPSFSAEMAGVDGIELLEVDALQESNGSIANSPSATAYFVVQVKPSEPGAMAYLRRITSADGGTPDFAPIDVFESAWTLWNLSLLGDLDAATLALCQPQLDFLERTWQVGFGVGTASEGTLLDGDDTSLVYNVLTHFGRRLDIEAVLSYEDEEAFRCFSLEADPSISANIHVLGALRQAGFDRRHPSVQKVLNFLQKNRRSNEFWSDKWHASPYYATSHAIINCLGFDDEMSREAADWMMKTQKPDGSWGFFHFSTAEETAYCVQALAVWKRSGGKVPGAVFKLAAGWLKDHIDPPYPSLWIGKCLYSPENVIRSVIQSALELAGE